MILAGTHLNHSVWLSMGFQTVTNTVEALKEEEMVDLIVCVNILQLITKL